jgi:hypothetical protein
MRDGGEQAMSCLAGVRNFLFIIPYRVIIKRYELCFSLKKPKFETSFINLFLFLILYENVVAPISAQKGLNTVLDVSRWLEQIFRLAPILMTIIRVMLHCQIFPLHTKIWISRHTFFFMDFIKEFFVSFKSKVKFFANKYLLDTVRQLGQKFKFQINQVVYKVQYKIFFFFLLEKYKRCLHCIVRGVLQRG